MAGLLNNPEVIFKEDTHQYFSTIDNEEYKSCSKVLSLFKQPFDREKISKMMAKKLAKDEGISEKQAQAEILAGWDKTKDDAIDHGNRIHDALEEYFKFGVLPDWLRPAVEQMKDILQTSFYIYPEALLYNHNYKVAGQSDLVIQRQRGKNSLIDIYDYKTNLSKGIYFDSINRKKDEIKHYNKFFLHPIDHLEECNYTLYALQLSIYGYLAELTYGVKIGRLCILYISPELKVTKLPVPYLKLEAKLLLDHNKNLKPLPTKEPARAKVKSQIDW